MSYREFMRAHKRPPEWLCPRFQLGNQIPVLHTGQGQDCAVLLIGSQRADIFGEGWEEEDRPRRRLLSSGDLACIEPCFYITSHVTLEGSNAL